MRLSSPVEIIETQNAIIRMQSEVINELFLLLSQHIAVEELDRLPCVDTINQAAEMRRFIE